MTQHPVRPWYREPWPWILMAGPAIVVVASFITLWLAVTGADPVIADNPIPRDPHAAARR